MTADHLRAWLRWHRWRPTTLARALGYSHGAVSLWLSRSRPIPDWLALAVCELTRRHAEAEGLGTLACPCGGLAVEDAGLDDRFWCVACGRRVDVDVIERSA